MKKFMLGICAFVLSLSLGWSPRVRADAVTDWNANAGKPAIATCIDPLNASRMEAMMHIAIHDALNTINRRFQPYVLDIRVPSDVSAEAAVATAAHDVLVLVFTQLPAAECIDAAIASIEADYTAALALIAEGSSKMRGIVEGGAAAQVLKRFFETDEVSFNTCSLTLTLPEEIAHGRKIGNRAVNHFLLPVE